MLVREYCYKTEFPVVLVLQGDYSKKYTQSKLKTFKLRFGLKYELNPSTCVKLLY